MNKSSPKVTIGAPAAKEEWAAVEARCTVTSQVVGVAQKDDAGTWREDPELLWKPDPHKLTPLNEVSSPLCQKVWDVWEQLMTTALLPHYASIHRHHCCLLPANPTWGWAAPVAAMDSALWQCHGTEQAGPFFPWKGWCFKVAGLNQKKRYTLQYAQLPHQTSQFSKNKNQHPKGWLRDRMLIGTSPCLAA